jgi:hypothetical protein
VNRWTLAHALDAESIDVSECCDDMDLVDIEIILPNEEVAKKVLSSAEKYKKMRPLLNQIISSCCSQDTPEFMRRFDFLKRISESWVGLSDEEFLNSGNEDDSNIIESRKKDVKHESSAEAFNANSMKRTGAEAIIEKSMKQVAAAIDLTADITADLLESGLNVKKSDGGVSFEGVKFVLV